jgi:alpha-D-ribose 1-methylphosphonate 5-triphosphate synthase subunit PhnG
MPTNLTSDIDNRMTELLQTTAARRDWLSVLARAETAQLEDCYRVAGPWPEVEPVRVPEVGMVMLRGRVGGTGGPFNLGEASLTRCALRLAGGALGVGYTLGRDRRKAELVALFDARLQDQDQRERLLTGVIAPLRRLQAGGRAATAQAVAGSRVEFFTLVRGEG